MQEEKCPSCGRDASACPGCPQPAANGAARQAEPPPEVASWKIERPTPEMIEEARRTFDAEEYLAGVREVERTGGVPFEEILAEIERKLHGRN